MHSKRLGVIALIAVVAVIGVIVVMHSRRERPAESKESNESPSVSVLAAQRGQISQDLTVAGIFQPFQEIDVHGKVSGYIRHIYVDIGDRVHQGQTLAVLEVPELDAQVAGAEAGVMRSQEDISRLKSEVARAQANYAATHANYVRLKQASDQQPGLVAAQELDDAQARDGAASSQIAAAQSAVAAAQGQLAVSKADQLRVSSMAQYATITAPFAGVITMRYADTGALIPSGTSESDAQAVVRLAQSDLMRLRMPIPEQDVPLVNIGATVMVHVQATGEQFPGKVIRLTHDVSNATRTMLVEVDVPNPKLTLTPGMYANVSFHLRQADNSLIVPPAAIIQGDQPSVFIVDANGILRRQRVVLGITSANEQEINGGLNEGDRVVLGDTATLQPGEHVQAQLAAKNLVTYQAENVKGGK